MPTSHKGLIKRNAYTRKSHTRKAYTRKDGTRVKAARVSSSHVPSAWIKDRGAPGKGPKLIPAASLKKAKLSKHGYAVKKSSEERHKSIRKAAKQYGTLATLRKLVALRTLQKSHPKIYSRLNSDVHYAQRLSKRKSSK